MTDRTCACLLTPERAGAIGVIRIWGSNAIAIADAVFRPARDPRLSETAPGVVRFGRVGANEGDEVVVVITDDDPAEVEIHGHGGLAAVELVLDALEKAGAERRRPVAWVRHASKAMVGAEALVDLARAPTLRTAEILLDQWHGAFDRELADKQGRDRLRARVAVGLRLISGWKVSIAGRPNVGKSRLMNALAGYTRAIVDPTPGTTRDLLTVRTSFDGWPVELVDTAGLRESTDPTEAEGILRARAAHTESDLVLLLLDRSQPLSDDDRNLIASHPTGLIVANKSDLPPAWNPTGIAAISISAERGDGLDRLIAMITSRLVPDPPPPGAGVPFRPRHVRMLDALR